jgi:hypothetical protein
MKLLRYLGKKIDGFRLGAWEIGSGATPPWLLVRLLPTCKHFNYFRWRVQLWPRKRLATWHKITISRILALQALGVQSPRRPTMICLISPTFPGERTQVYACSGSSQPRVVQMARSIPVPRCLTNCERSAKRPCFPTLHGPHTQHRPGHLICLETSKKSMLMYRSSKSRPATKTTNINTSCAKSCRH